MVHEEGTPLDPDAIAQRQFRTSFRGYDTSAVRAFLGQLAENQRSLIAQLAATETAVADSLAAAEARAAEVLREAQDEARHQLAGVASERDRGYDEGVAEAEAERAVILASAQAEADVLLVEAKAARQRVLMDLRRRRKAARVQVEQLHAARERLLVALTTVRGAIDVTTTGLRDALPEAKAAADAAARRVEDEADVSVEQLEAEIESLRLAGLTIGGSDADLDEVDIEVEVDTGEVPEVHAGDRRSSSVRIVRPMRAANAVTGLPEEELLPVDVPDPVEEVRLVTAEDVAAEEMGDVEEVEDVESEPEVDAEASGELERDASQDGLGEPEPEAETQAEPEAEADEAEAEAGAEPDAEPEAEAERLSADTVDALFARLKAGRADRVAEAEVVLAAEAVGEPEPPPPTEPAPEVEPEADAVAEPPSPTREPSPDDLAVHRGGGPEREALLARRDELVAPAQAALLRRLKRVLADEQNAVLDALRRLGPTKALPDVDDHAGQWAQAAAPDLAAAAAAGSAFLGGDAPVVEPTPADLAAVAEALATVVARPLHERLVRVVEAADTDDDAAAAGIRACYRTWRTERLVSAVDHAVLDAFSLGVDRALGEGTPVCWIADDGGVPCPDAEDNALAGEVPCGVRFPTGHTRPPAHHGCRCLVTRVGP